MYNITVYNHVCQVKIYNISEKFVEIQSFAYFGIFIRNFIKNNSKSRDSVLANACRAEYNSVIGRAGYHGPLPPGEDVRRGL